jgi:DNA-binding NtrC family response regulator
MISTSPRLLCYGHDEMLLWTRQLILDREFFVEKCDTLAGLTEILARGPLDLVVMCQSVPDAECEQVLKMVRVASPEVKVLVLEAGHSGSCSPHSDAAMDNMEGPRALLREIHTLLGSDSGSNAHPG